MACRGSRPVSVHGDAARHSRRLSGVRGGRGRGLATAGAPRPGALGGAIRARRRAFVEHVLAGMDAIPITEPVARVHADIWADLSARGEAIGAHDLWIGATALAHSLGVATRNGTHFQRIDGLRVVTAAA